MIELFSHQAECLDKTKGMKRVAFFLEMGLGKTHLASEKMFEIGNKISLVICQKSKVADWSIHFKSNYGDKVLVIDYTKKSNQALSAEDMMMYSDPVHVIVIVNYELAWRRPELARLSGFTLILDESSMIQNPEAKQTRFIMRKLNQDAIILLSGTPVGGKFENLWTQSYLLGCGLTKREFEKKFVNFEILDRRLGFPIKIVDRRNPYRNVGELKQMLRDHNAIFMKTEDVMTLPEQRTIKVYCPLTAEYRKYLKGKVIQLPDRELVGSTSLTFRLGLRALASGYSKHKLNSFRDLVQSTSDRLIVFYNFIHELKALEEIAKEERRPVSYVNGQCKDLRFYESEDNSITFVQYQAGAMGLNLQKANKIIYFSLPERSELFEQSKKRIHRIGQKNACTYYILQTASSIDELIYRALEQKKDYTDELFREQYIGR
jgi:SNF2 family DNA or RNA helicase